MQKTLPQRFLITAFVAGLTVSAAWSQPSEKPAEEAKPPWERTLEERLAERYDPEKVAARARAQYQRTIEEGQDLPTYTPEEVAILAPGRHTISGNENPELLFASDLFNSLLNRGFPPDRENRQWLREALADRSKGLVADDSFWRDLSILAAEYLSMRHQVRQLFVALDATEDPEENVKLRARLKEVQRGRCRLHWETLQACREHFGKKAFDRFLYEAVAPGFLTSGPYPDETWAPRSHEEALEQLKEQRRLIETGGCPDED